MAKVRLRQFDGFDDDPAQSGERPVTRDFATTSVAPLMHPRRLEDNWDDRYGLLPPEPPKVPEHQDSVAMALSELNDVTLPRYGSFPGVTTLAQTQAELKSQINTGLSFVGGYVDAVGFVALVGLFPSHVTGELVSLSALLTSGGSEVGHQALLAGLFLLGVLSSVALAHWVNKTKRSPYILQLALLSACLIAFLMFGLTLGWGLTRQTWLTTTAGAAVFAMGVQNAIMRSSLAGTLPTTVMTGNLTQLITELFNWACGRLEAVEDKEQQHQSMRKASTLGRALACFFGGATLGAWLTRELGLVSVLLPAVIAVSMTAHAFAVERDSSKRA